MDTEKCKIKLDSPENIYFSGQEIKGQITIILTKWTKIRGISYIITGYGKCNWCEFLRRDNQVSSTVEKEMQRSMVYSSREEYINHKSYIIGSKSSKPIELQPGKHTYDFAFTLSNSLPSSFKGSYGSVKYKMEFIVEKAWYFDDKYRIPIIVVKSIPQSVFGSYTAPILQQLTRNIGIFSGGPVSLVAELPSNNVIRGNKFKLCVTVDNKSGTHVEKLKFSIRQIVTYFSQQPLPYVKREEVIKIYKKETGSIEKKSSRTFEHELEMPYCQPSDDSYSKIIFIRYEVQIDAVLPGLHKNITINLPLIVCSHERNQPQPYHQLHQHTSRMSSINIGWAALYPNLNTSMTSLASSEQSTSPSHSLNNSQISNRSSDGSISLSPLNISNSATRDQNNGMFHSLPTFGTAEDLPRSTTPLSQSATEYVRYSGELPVLPRRSATPPTNSSIGFIPQLSTYGIPQISDSPLAHQPPPEYNRNSMFAGDPSTSAQYTSNIQISCDIRASTIRRSRRSTHTTQIGPPTYDELFGNTPRMSNVPSAPPVEKA